MSYFVSYAQKGKQSMYNLGKYLRERYGGFLPELYFSSDVQVISSNSDTCLTSAAVLLAGLYPPHKYQIWNPHILWQPIPVKGISSEVDKVSSMYSVCVCVCSFAHGLKSLSSFRVSASLILSFKSHR